MLLMILMESQAVCLLLSFSPSAASSCSGTPLATDSTRRPASAGPGPGSGPVQPESGWSSESFGRGRLERGRPDPAGPRRAQSFDCRQGCVDAGPPRRGGAGRSPLCSHPSGLLRCGVSVVVGAARIRLRRAGSAPWRRLVVNSMGASRRSVA
jgi:hypothetical protein